MGSCLEAGKISAIYDYLTSLGGELPGHAEVSFVFGRKSSHLVDAAVKAARCSDALVVSGNIGKDSGDLPKLGIPEAEFIINGVSARGALPKRGCTR
jgi:hypothetical protein